MYQYGTLIKLCNYRYSWTLMIYTTMGHQWTMQYGHVSKHYAILWLLILITVAARISLKFKYVSGQYVHKYTWAQLSKMTYTLSSVISYKQLSCIIIYKTSKGVNKYMQLIIPTIVQLWHDGALQSKLSLVYIVCFHQSMSKWGNGESGNYTHVIPKPNHCFLSCPFQHLLPNFEARVMHVLKWLVINTVSTT